MKSDKENIDKFVTLEKENNIWNHFLSSFWFNSEILVDKKANKYVLWSSNYWAGILYPIVEINFDDENNISGIKTELNIIARIFKYTFLTGWLVLVGFLSLTFIKDISSGFSWMIVFSFFTVVPYFLLLRIYRIESRAIIENLKIAVNLISQNDLDKIESTKNEWTFKNSLGRIIIYPFTIFIITISIYMIFNGEIVKGIPGIIICVLYLYSDIKILVKKRKNKLKNQM